MTMIVRENKGIALKELPGVINCFSLYPGAGVLGPLSDGKGIARRKMDGKNQITVSVTVTELINR